MSPLSPVKAYKKRKARKAEKILEEYDKTHATVAADIKHKEKMQTIMANFKTENNSENKDHYVNTIATAKKNADLELIKEKFPGFIVVDHVLMTRHGKSTWKEKGLGLLVNAPLSVKQTLGLMRAKTKQFTHHLLSSPEKKLTVVSSTMLRAKHTTSLTVPEHKNVSNIDITLDKDLTEVGSFASSAGYTFTSGVGKPWWIFALIFTTPALISRYFSSKEVDKQLVLRQTESDPNYKDSLYKTEKLTTNEADAQNIGKKNKKESRNFSSLSGEEKATSIKNIIDTHHSSEDKDKGDLWLFGHGGTFKKFFKSMFGLEYKFDYLTTKEFYCLKGPDGKVIYYSPPGGIKIEENGEFKGLLSDSDRGLVSPNFNRKELIEFCERKLIDDIKSIRQEIHTAAIANDSLGDIKELKDKLFYTVKANYETLSKHITLYNEEQRILSKPGVPPNEIRIPNEYYEKIREMGGQLNTLERDCKLEQDKKSPPRNAQKEMFIPRAATITERKEVKRLAQTDIDPEHAPLTPRHGK